MRRLLVLLVENSWALHSYGYGRFLSGLHECGRSSGQWIAEAFANGADQMEIRSPFGKTAEEVRSWILQTEEVIFIVPLYIHGMPGSMMRLMEELPDCTFAGRRVGFIIQLGFTESSQARYLLRYFECLMERWEAIPIGMVVKGSAAGISMMPRMFRKPLKLFTLLGMRYRETSRFDETLSKQLASPETLSPFQARLIQFFCDIGLNDIGWHQELKKNDALDRHLDRPFLSCK